VRANRISLDALKICHWGDAKIWSRKFGLISTSLLTDNLVGRSETITARINAPDPAGYLMERTPTPTRAGAEELEEWVPAGTMVSDACGKLALQFDSAETLDFFHDVLPSVPFVVLLHPEFYAE
jgi:hypothetical protein